MTAPSKFTYASFMTRAGYGSAGGGGWSVGERSGDLTDAELRSLVEWVPTRLDTVSPVPKYASAEEIADLPHRIAWSRAPWGADHVLWASAPAGEDATGRAGNVFSQVWVFRAYDDGSTVNPARFLDSPSLTFPFGSREVNATLDNTGDSSPEPGGYADGADIWSRLLEVEDIDLQALLLGLLDAVESGSFVILAGDGNRAALLIEAMCGVATPEAAAALTWSTFERVRGLGRAREQGFDIVCVPAQDAAEARMVPGALVIDLNQEPELGTYRGGGTRLGETTVPVSVWSTLVQLWAYTLHEAVGPETPALTPSRAWQVAVPVLRESQLRQEASEALLDLFSRDEVPRNLPELVPTQAVSEFLIPAVDIGSVPETVNAVDTVAKAGAFRRAQTEIARNTWRRDGLADRILADPVALVSSTRQVEPSVRAVIRDLIAENPHLMEMLMTGDGITPELSQWLDVKNLTLTLLASADRDAPPEDFRTYDENAALVAAMVLGELQTPTAAGARTVDDNPWDVPTARWDSPEADDAGWREPTAPAPPVSDSATGGWGKDWADDWGALEQPASVDSVTPSAVEETDDRERRLAISGVTVAFGLNSLYSLVGGSPGQPLADSIRSAEEFLRHEDRPLLVEGPWRELFTETPRERVGYADHEMEPLQAPAAPEPEPFPSYEPEQDPESIFDPEEYGQRSGPHEVELRTVTEAELSAIVRHPCLKWRSYWSEDIWRDSSHADMHVRAFEILLRETDADPLLEQAQNTILALFAANYLASSREAYSVILPWWRYSGLQEARVEEISRIAGEVLRKDRPGFIPRRAAGEEPEVPDVLLEISHRVSRVLADSDSPDDPRDRRRRSHGQRGQRAQRTQNPQRGGQRSSRPMDRK